MREPTMRVVPAGPERDAYLPLLDLADDSIEQVRGYYQTGALFALDGVDGTPTGMILAVPEADGTVELKAVAVEASLHGRGIGTRLLREVLNQLRAGGVRRVIVGTSSSGIGQLAYYQKAGFRLWKIDRDFFSPGRGYPDGIEENGIPLRDMVWMDQEFDDRSGSDAR
jgi:ribosomal protein S18 acetylase RimI-like enzyme